jgi:tetratricopeptide (TPR) repeat protein
LLAVAIHRPLIRKTIKPEENMTSDSISVSKKDKSDKHYKQAEKFYGAAKYDEALIECNQAIELTPDNGDAYNLRGLIFIEKDLLNEAHHEFREALRLDPSNKEFKENLIDTNYYQSEEVVDHRFKALRIVGTIYKVVGIFLGVITVLIALLSFGLSINSGSLLDGIASNISSSINGSGGLLGNLLIGMISGGLVLIIGGIPSLTSYAFGEGIYLFLALEENTRGTFTMLLQQTKA